MSPPADTPNRPTRVRFGQALGTCVVLAVVLGLASWRVLYVLRGPDPDSDAYGHHVIARFILESPRDLSVHWVWLPLFHYAQAVGMLLGATFDSVRLVNVAISAAIPLLLFVLLQRQARERRGAAAPHPSGGGSSEGEPIESILVPAVAAIVCALSPIGMQMGTTGQPEPIFCLFVLAAVAALDRARPGLCAGILCGAVLTRYEGWPIAPTLGVLLAGDWVLVRLGVRWWRTPGWIAASPRRALLPVICPLLAIFAWAALLRWHDGRWFHFLGETRQFASEVMKSKSSLDWGVRQLILDILHYAWFTAWRIMSYPLLLAPLGLVRTVRRQGVTFAAVYLCILAFVTFAWINRATLGLDRHFAVLVPFYAVLVAQGMAELGRWIRAGFNRVSARAGLRAEVAAVVGIGLVTVAVTYGRLSAWWTDWENASRGLWPERRAVAAFLRTVPADATIFCDEPTFEIMSGLDRHRFDRRPLAAPATRDRIALSAQTHGVAFIASWAVRVNKLRDMGEVVYRPEAAPDDETGPTVVRVLGPGR
jgi:hypothetical protein